MRETQYEALTDRITRVSKSKFVPSTDGTYKVKLEGAGYVGKRVYHIVGVRDPNAIKNIDTILKDTYNKVDDILAPKKRGVDFHLFFHVYGKNAIMKELEPQRESTSNELCIVIEAISNDNDLCTTVVKCAKFRLFYMSYPGQMNSSGGAVALLTDEPLYPPNSCYKWTIDHLLNLKDPLDKRIFRYSFELVNGNI
jgi:hypothetical protein